MYVYACIYTYMCVCMYLHICVYTQLLALSLLGIKGCPPDLLVWMLGWEVSLIHMNIYISIYMYNCFSRHDMRSSKASFPPPNPVFAAGCVAGWVYQCFEIKCSICMLRGRAIRKLTRYSHTQAFQALDLVFAVSENSIFPPVPPRQGRVEASQRCADSYGAQVPSIWRGTDRTG